MPIKSTNKGRYPKNWVEIRAQILERRADSKCEWCGAANYQPHPDTGSRVVLTIAHLDHTPENCEEWNLRALCQRCHNRYDTPFRKQNRRIKTLEDAIDEIWLTYGSVGVSDAEISRTVLNICQRVSNR